MVEEFQATKIIRLGELPTFAPDGSVQRSRTVVYMVGESGPFQIEVPAKGFDAAVVRTMVEEEAQKIRLLLTG